jgi:fructokinase
MVDYTGMRIGIDLGGTKIEGIALDDRGTVRLRRRVASPHGDYGNTLEAIADLVRAIERELGVRGTVGVGIPGTISAATGLVKNANSTWLNGRPLGDDLPRLLDRPVRFANDANCFALSEASDGAGAGGRVVFGVIIGTGTGGGVVVHGRVIEGANGIAGEWGHNPLPAPLDDERPGPACYCGRSGCIETFLSGPGLVRDYAGARGLVPGARKQNASVANGDAASQEGECGTLTAQDIAARAASGEPRASACLARYEDRLARALGTVINVVDPDVVVLGGGLSNIDRLYESVPRIWARYIFSDSVTTRLARAMHGDSSGVRGAAWLWERR